jgi:hypothetical protein
MMDRDEIDDVIYDIAKDYGVDTKDITDFIMPLLSGKGDEWAKRYREPINRIHNYSHNNDYTDTVLFAKLYHNTQHSKIRMQ